MKRNQSSFGGCVSLFPNESDRGSFVTRPFSLRSSVERLQPDATAPVLGALSSLAVKIPESYPVLSPPFFAGGFLYLGASDLLPLRELLDGR